MPERNEFKIWNVPPRWGKWIYLGTIAILIYLLKVQNDWLKECNKRNDIQQEVSGKRLEGWIDKLLEERLKNVDENTIKPKLEEVKSVADSIKTSKI